MAESTASRKEKLSALISIYGAGYLLFFDDSEDEDLEAPVTNRLVKISNFAELTIPLQNELQFKAKFRMNRRTFDLLRLKLEPLICNAYDRTSAGRRSTSGSKQLMVAIYVLANQIPYREQCYFGGRGNHDHIYNVIFTSDFCRIVAELFNISTRTAHQSVIRVVKAILHLNKIEKIITWPRGQQALDVIYGFQEASGFPGVLGAIDGAHIPIPAPKKDGMSYVNRKNFHSVLLQAVCDNSMKFTSCYAGEVGSVHDSCVFRRSPLQDIMKSHESFITDSHLLGDAAYPLSTRLLTPFRDNGHLGRREVKFNNTLSKARCTIERAFALLKGRFRRLKMLEMRKIEFIPPVIVACCVLHNVCITQNDFLDETFEEDDDVGCLIEDGCEQATALEKRNCIANSLSLFQ